MAHFSTQPESDPYAVLKFAATAAGAGVLAALPRSWAESGFVHAALSVMVVQIVLTLACGVAVYQRETAHSWRSALRQPNWLLWTAIAALLTMIVVMAVPAEFRILADETNLISTSFSLYRDGRAMNVTQGVVYYGTWHTIGEELPDRPMLFSVMMTVLHVLFGYSARHGFWVNALCMGGTLATVIAIGRRLHSTAFGIIAAVLLATFPLYEICCRAAGYEAINIFCLTLLLAGVVHFATKPSALTFELCLWLALLTAQCRKESVVMLAPIIVLGAAIRWRWRRSGEWRFGDMSPRLFFMPLVMVPAIWQRRITNQTINAGDKIEHPFSLKFLPGNLGKAGHFFFDASTGSWGLMPVSQLTAILFIIGTAMLGWYCYRRRQTGKWPLPLALTIYSGGIFAIFTVFMSYYNGDITSPAMGRYALSAAHLMALAAAVPLIYLWRWRSLRLPLIGLLAGNAAYGLSIGSRNEYINQLTLTREYKANLSTLANFPQDTTLIVSDRPGMYTAQHFGAVGFDWVNHNTERLVSEIRRHLYENVIAFQFVDYATQIARPALPSQIIPDVIREYQNTADYYIRVSKLRVREEPKPFVGPPAPPENSGGRAKSSKIPNKHRN